MSSMNEYGGTCVDKPASRVRRNRGQCASKAAKLPAGSRVASLGRRSEGAISRRRNDLPQPRSGGGCLAATARLWRHLHVERGRTLADPTGCVVVGAVARTEPAVVVARSRNRHAAEMGAHAENDEQLRLLHAVQVRLRVAQLRQVHICCLGDLGLYDKPGGSNTSWAATRDGGAPAGPRAAHARACSPERDLMKTGFPRHLTVMQSPSAILPTSTCVETQGLKRQGVASIAQLRADAPRACVARARAL